MVQLLRCGVFCDDNRGMGRGCRRDHKVGNVDALVINFCIAIRVIRFDLDADIAAGGEISPGLADLEKDRLPFIRFRADRVAQRDPLPGIPVIHRPRPHLRHGRRSFEVQLQQHGGDQVRAGILRQAERMVAEVDGIRGLEGDVCRGDVARPGLLKQAEA